MRFLTLFLAGLAALAAAPVLAQEFPELTGQVTDAASIIPEDVEARLTEKLAALEQQSQRQLVVATIPDLQGYEISDYGYRLGREWGIGDKERNDGALLIVAPNERKVRIEVAYGLEPVLTDGLSWQIVNNEILPRFKEGNMPGGIEAGVDAIVTQLTLPEEEAMRLAAKAEEAPEADWFVRIFFFVFFMIFFGMPILAAMGIIKSAKHGRSRGRSTVWSTGGWSSGGSSSWGGGGFSGGGFSGGGGSFGGGGSSGSW
ncbi:MAG: TPM domain-containing protein [Novosphingobium sp.]|nr:TPM domain-containing protein [Novosphingobium sp.]